MEIGPGDPTAQRTTCRCLTHRPTVSNGTNRGRKETIGRSAQDGVLPLDRDGHVVGDPDGDLDAGAPLQQLLSELPGVVHVGQLVRAVVPTRGVRTPPSRWSRFFFEILEEGVRSVPTLGIPLPPLVVPKLIEQGKEKKPDVGECPDSLKSRCR